MEELKLCRPDFRTQILSTVYNCLPIVSETAPIKLSMQAEGKESDVLQ